MLNTLKHRNGEKEKWKKWKERKKENERFQKISWLLQS